MKEKLFQTAIELTNGRLSSKVLKRFTTSKISKHLIRPYVQVFQIKTVDLAKEMHEYDTLQQFFVRALKPSARYIDMSPKTYVSPVDAKIESFGKLSSHTTFFVKGKKYCLTDLLGKEDNAEMYKNGQYIVFYLSPADYHRIHSPFNGTVRKQYVLGEKSYPVNQLGLSYGKSPISGNYRLVSEMTDEAGKYSAFIKVGAMFVNSISLTHTATQWEKGQEIGHFAFGSTVVMIFEENSVEFLSHIQKDRHIQVGEPFANML